MTDLNAAPKGYSVNADDIVIRYNRLMWVRSGYGSRWVEAALGVDTHNPLTHGGQWHEVSSSQLDSLCNYIKREKYNPVAHMRNALKVCKRADVHPDSEFSLTLQSVTVQELLVQPGAGRCANHFSFIPECRDCVDSQ